MSDQDCGNAHENWVFERPHAENRYDEEVRS